MLEFRYNGQHWTFFSVIYHSISLQEYWKPNCSVFTSLRHSYTNAASVVAGITISDWKKCSSSKQVVFSVLPIVFMFKEKPLKGSGCNSSMNKKLEWRGKKDHPNRPQIFLHVSCNTLTVAILASYWVWDKPNPLLLIGKPLRNEDISV